MGADLWCQQDISLPQNIPIGKPYTLYWVWDWPTMPKVDSAVPNGKEEIYTTCIDIDIIPESVVQKFGYDEYVSNQSLNNAAIPSQMAQIHKSLISSCPAFS